LLTASSDVIKFACNVVSVNQIQTSRVTPLQTSSIHGTLFVPSSEEFHHRFFTAITMEVRDLKTEGWMLLDLTNT